MIPYVVLALVVGATSGFAELVSRRVAGSRRDQAGAPAASAFTVFDLIPMFALIAFSGMRVGVGTDYLQYARFYGELTLNDWSGALARSPQEAGFTFLSLCLRQFSSSPALLFWAAAVLTVVPVYVAVKRRSANPTLALLLYVLLAFYLNPLNLVRQGIAMSLNFYSTRYISSKRFWFVAINLLAASFHASAIVAALVQWVFRGRTLTRRFVVSLGLFSAVSLLILTQVAQIGGLVAMINPRYALYLEDGKSGLLIVGLGTGLVVAFRLLTLLLSSILPARGVELRYQVFVALSIPFLLAGFVSAPVARLEYYFSIFTILLIPDQLLRKSKSGTVTSIVVIVALVFFLFSLRYFNGLVPYMTGV